MEPGQITYCRAVEVVRNSDIAVVAVGTRSTYLGRSPKYSTAGEGFDLSSLELPGVQEELLKEIKKTGKPMIVVLIAGKPLAMPWVKENADALLVQWYARWSSKDVHWQIFCLER